MDFQVCPAACRIGPVAENLRENHIFEVIADVICHDFAFETDRALVPEILIVSIFQTAFPFFYKCGKVGCESCGIQDHRIAQFPECLFLFACEFVAQFPVAPAHHIHILFPSLEEVIVQAFFPGRFLYFQQGFCRFVGQVPGFVLFVIIPEPVYPRTAVSGAEK